MVIDVRQSRIGNQFLVNWKFSFTKIRQHSNFFIYGVRNEKFVGKIHIIISTRSMKKLEMKFKLAKIIVAT